MNRRLQDVLDLDDFERVVRDRLPRAVYAYVKDGSETEAALRGNRQAFEAWHLMTRVLVDVAGRSQQTELFGRTYASPFGIAPMGGSGLVAYDAEVAMARAARAAAIPFVLSANTIIPLEEVARHDPGAWFAAYQRPDRAAIEGMVDRVARAGFAVLALTTDVPVESNREASRRAGFGYPIQPSARLTWDVATHPRWLLGVLGRTMLHRGIPRLVNLEPSGGPALFSSKLAHMTAHDRLSWEHVRMMRELWKRPFVLKGLLSPADVATAREHGVDGVILSNHGGRQLDYAVAPMSVLQAAVQAARGMPVMIDSGFRRGTDVLKALALGARFVFVGRPFLYAAACAGERGVRHGVDLLTREVDKDMALLGLSRIGDARQEMVVPAAEGAMAHAAS